MIWFNFEKALRILTEYYSKKSQKKPALFHSIRVGVFLYHKGFNEEIQIAWLLHDIIEDSNIPQSVILENFWDNVLKIILANSKNTNIAKEEILEDIIKKCIEYWEDALIVKMADVYDNFLFYVKENIHWEIERCKYLAELIKSYKPDNWNNEIFRLLDEILKYNYND